MEFCRSFNSVDLWTISGLLARCYPNTIWVSFYWSTAVANTPLYQVETVYLESLYQLTLTSKLNGLLLHGRAEIDISKLHENELMYWGKRFICEDRKQDGGLYSTELFYHCWQTTLSVQRLPHVSIKQSWWAADYRPLAISELQVAKHILYHQERWANVPNFLSWDFKM